MIQTIMTAIATNLKIFRTDKKTETRKMKRQQLKTIKKKKKKSGAQVMGADSLLKMVCEHIIVAKVPSLNAELVFLEEFARDEQLLRGKEGYSLVTLQASLHFLNASTDFNEDIFKNEE
mmetsp:Transcript_6712/g.8618  ORF Transcript_6712/g.8618 Transcript_6712/m.8618 type:complete len:119 (-) Transcript_6712:40-396(-)